MLHKGGRAAAMKFHVARVQRHLASAAKVVEADKQVVFSNGGGASRRKDALESRKGHILVRDKLALLLSIRVPGPMCGLSIRSHFGSSRYTGCSNRCRDWVVARRCDNGASQWPQGWTRKPAWPSRDRFAGRWCCLVCDYKLSS
jgi:hypothetical protein